MNYNEIISLVYEARKFVFDKSARADVKEKNPLDFVTAVDTGISDFLKEKLYELYPDVGFVTEEEPGYSRIRCLFLTLSTARQTSFTDTKKARYH